MLSGRLPYNGSLIKKSSLEHSFLPAMYRNLPGQQPEGEEQHPLSLVHYMQELTVYKDGKQIATNTPATGPKVWNLTVLVTPGSRYILAQQADLGDPYGGFRGHPGLR